MPHLAARSSPPGASRFVGLLALTTAWMFAACGVTGAVGTGPQRDAGGRDTANDTASDTASDAVDDAEVSAEDAPAPDSASDTAPEDVAEAGQDAPLLDGSADATDTVCRDVDILFVIDSSASMADQQASLIASFEGFIDGVQARLEGALSIHIGVVQSDNTWSNPDGCTDIGDLVTHPAGIGSSDRACGPFREGGAYLVESEPDLVGAFGCVAQVGIGGADDERMARALLNAVQPERNAPGGCNAGFARPDSLLVVVLISDEDDVEDGCDPSTGVCLSVGSGGTPDDWVAELLTSRPNRDDIVVLSLIGRTLDNPCGAQVSSRLLGFARRFGDNGFVGDVCAASYDGFFADALPLIERACGKEP